MLRSNVEQNLVADRARTSPIGEDASVLLTIGQAQIFCGGRELTDPIDQQVAWTFMQWGDGAPVRT